MGNDTAGHPRELKEADLPPGINPPSGIWNAPTAFPLWAHLFERHDATVAQLQFFASEAGARFYNLRRGENNILHMVRKSWIVPESYGDNLVVPLFAGHEMQWQAVEK
mgnify:CR=1 FL=1